MANDQPNILKNGGYLPQYEGDVISESFPRVQSVLDRESSDFKYSQEDYGYYNQDFFYQDPLFLSFDIILDTYQSPLFGLQNSLSNFLTKYDTIPSIHNRIDIYNEFYDIVRRLFNVGNQSIDKNKSYYISSISGLDKITAKMVDYQKDKISITMADDVSMITSYMVNLYNNLSYSYKDQRYIIPQNLLRFNMYIRVSDLRNMPTFKKIEGEIKKEYDKSSIIYYLRDCNFIFYDSKPFDTDLSVGGWGGSMPANPATLKFDIIYKSIDVEIHNPLLKKVTQNKGNLNNKSTSLVLDPDKGDLHGVFSNSLKFISDEDNDKLRSVINSPGKIDESDNQISVKDKTETLSAASTGLKDIMSTQINKQNRVSGTIDFEKATSYMTDTIKEQIESSNLFRNGENDDFQKSTSDMFDIIDEQIERSDSLRQKSLDDIMRGNLYVLPQQFQNNFLENWLRDRFLELTGLPKITLMDPFGNIQTQAELDARRNERAFYALNGISVLNNNALIRNGSGSTTQNLGWKIDTSFKVKPQENLGDVPSVEPIINTVVLGQVPFEEPQITPVDLGELSLIPPVEQPIELGNIPVEPFIIQPVDIGKIPLFTTPREPIQKIDLMPDVLTQSTQNLGKINTSFESRLFEDMGDIIPEPSERIEPDLGKINLVHKQITSQDLGNISKQQPVLDEVDLGKIATSIKNVSSANLGNIPTDMKEINVEKDLGKISFETTEEIKPVELGEIDKTTREQEKIEDIGDLYSNEVSPREIELGFLDKSITERNILEMLYLYTKNNSFKSMENTTLYDNVSITKQSLNDDKIESSIIEKSPFELVKLYENGEIDIKTTVENIILYNNDVNKINNLNSDKILSDIKYERDGLVSEKIYDVSDGSVKRLEMEEYLYEPKNKDPFENLGFIEQTAKEKERDDILGRLYYNDANKKLLDVSYLYINDIDRSVVELGRLYDIINNYNIKSIDDGKKLYENGSVMINYGAEYDIKNRSVYETLYKIEREDMSKFKQEYLYGDMPDEYNRGIGNSYIEVDVDKENRNLIDGERLYDNTIKIEKEKDVLKIDTEIEFNKEKIDNLNIINQTNKYIDGLDKYDLIGDKEIRKEIFTETSVYEESDMYKKKKEMPIKDLYENDEIKHEVEKETFRIDQSSKEKNVYDKLNSNDVIQTKEIKSKSFDESHLQVDDQWKETNFLTKYDRIDGTPRKIEGLDKKELYDNDQIFKDKGLYDDKIDFEIKKQIEFDQNRLYDNDINENKLLEKKYLDMEIRETDDIHKNYLYDNKNVEKRNDLKNQPIDKEVFDRKTLHGDEIYMDLKSTKNDLNNDKIDIEPTTSANTLNDERLDENSKEKTNDIKDIEDERLG